jgi:hypothetical protein
MKIFAAIIGIIAFVVGATAYCIGMIELWQYLRQFNGCFDKIAIAIVCFLVTGIAITLNKMEI